MVANNTLESILSSHYKDGIPKLNDKRDVNKNEFGFCVLYFSISKFQLKISFETWGQSKCLESPKAWKIILKMA
jgi:hypothetical protein